MTVTLGDAKRGRTSTVLRSKLRAPGLPDDLVKRSRLVGAFSAATGLPLTVVLGPVGYGKTTAAAIWAKSANLPVAWLSLDSADNDPVRLYRHLAAALRRVHPSFGEGLEALTVLPDLPGGEALGEALADAMHDLPSRTALVIDDLHLLTDPSALAVVQTLVRYPAPELALVVITRSAGMFDLGRLLAHAQAGIIDGAMLRFTRQETTDFLSKHGVDPAVSASLEGWPAGLRLAAMAGPSASILEPAGAARDLLLEAALDSTDAEAFSLLLAASTLEEVSGELCAAIQGREADAPEFRATLSRMAEHNAFFTPLDAKREWYRIEALFREALLERARRTHGDEWIARMRRQAGEWFSGRGMVDAAITHALLSGDPEFTADLVERHAFVVMEALDWGSVEGWLNRLTESVISERPWLLIVRAGCVAQRGAIGLATASLNRAESLLPAMPEPRQAELQPLLMGVRADVAMFGRSDAEQALDIAERASALLPPGQFLGRGTELVARPLWHAMRGESDQAIAFLEQRLREQRTPNSAYMTTPHLMIAAVHIIDGNPARAVEASGRLAELARKVGLPSRETWAASLHGVALLQMNSLPEAEAAFDRHQSLAFTGQMNFIANQEVVFGRSLICQVTGRPDEAAAITDRYLRLLTLSPSQELIDLVRSFRARLAVMNGNFDGALGMLAMLPEAPLRQPMSLLERMSLTRAVVLAASGERAGWREATEICRRVRHRAGRANEIRARVIEAGALERLDERDDADATLAEALELAIGRGVVWPFVEGMGQIVPVLKRLAAVGNVDAAVALALAPRPDADTVAPDPVVQDLVLTRRELEVLHALHRGLTNKQIAEELFIAPATVKRHTASLFRKLGVTTRTQAVLHEQSIEIFRRLTGPGWTG
jgi:LuxR family transcriptional regulator, maltose regulon positive regulatory protein